MRILQSPSECVDLVDSERPAPAGKRIRRSARDSRIELSFYLRSREGARPAGPEPGEDGYRPIEREDLAAERAALHADDIERIERWAAAEGLGVTRRDPARRLVKVAGSARRIERALGTALYDYRDGDVRYRGRAGPIALPAALAGIVEGVFGLDTRPAGESQLVPMAGLGTAAGHLPSAFAALYNFPATPGLGAGQTIALLEFGGAYRNGDIDLAFAAMGRPRPQIVSEIVGTALPKPGTNESHDREVALNIQVAGGLAPGARIVVYFANNDGQGWVDAVSRAVHDLHHRPSIISISWAGQEKVWDAVFPAHRKRLSQLFGDAARLGITIVAAAGNKGPTWMAASGKLHVGFPASDPFVCGCGGTSLQMSGGTLRETVWNRPTEGVSGGGVSEVYGRPAWQSGAAVPANAAGAPGRGVPDVAAVSDRRDGYRIFVNGRAVVLEGTSAVAPLWAALVARINEANGRRAGFFLPRLYAAAGSVSPGVNDVTTGNNLVGGVGFAAGAGWDPCTGLGSPSGGALRFVI